MQQWCFYEYSPAYDSSISEIGPIEKDFLSHGGKGVLAVDGEDNICFFSYIDDEGKVIRTKYESNDKKNIERFRKKKIIENL